MILELLLFLSLIQVKHWLIDFVIQTKSEIQTKGQYGKLTGINHSFKHSVGTMICAVLVLNPIYIEYVFLLGALDLFLHYHIDWLKMNYGNKDFSSSKFWNHLGLDQMAHQFCYIGYAFILT